MEETKKDSITYNDVFNRSMLLNALPLGGISGKPLCDIIMLQVDCGKVVNAFNDRMNEGLKKLKEEKFPKFDEESQKEEKDRCPEYKEWLKELEALYGSLRSEEATKPCAAKLPKISRAVLEAFCTSGAEGDVTFPGGTEASPYLVPKVTVLHMLAEMVED